MLKVYIMRHGEAGYSAISDSSRPLTSFGQKQCASVAYWFKQHDIVIDLAMVSPYLRAQQSFAFFPDQILVNKIETSQWLTPSGNTDQVINSLIALPSLGISSVLLVSHLPLVGYLVNDLCPHIAPPMFSPADVAFVTLSAGGQGKLEWFHHPI